jgi:hypothetical protein
MLALPRAPLAGLNAVGMTHNFPALTRWAKSLPPYGLAAGD